MNVDQFFAKWAGVAADFDGWYGNQCVDLFNFYNRDVVGAGPMFTPDTGGAADLWNDFDRNRGSDYYDKIPNSADFVPQKGDVIIWAANTSATGAAGHVAIATGKGDTNSFQSFDQNYPTGALPHFYTHVYTGVYGVLRPKNLTAPAPTPAPNGDTSVKATDNTVRLAYQGILLRDAAAADVAVRADQQDEEALLRELNTSPEHGDVVRLYNLGKQAEAEGWQGKAAAADGFQAAAQTAQKQAKDANGVITDMTGELTTLKAQLAAVAAWLEQPATTRLVSAFREVLTGKSDLQEAIDQENPKPKFNDKENV